MKDVATTRSVEHQVSPSLGGAKAGATLRMQQITEAAVSKHWLPLAVSGEPEAGSGKHWRKNSEASSFSIFHLPLVIGHCALARAQPLTNEK